jgi:hypothetical protein
MSNVQAAPIAERGARSKLPIEAGATKAKRAPGTGSIAHPSLASDHAVTAPLHDDAGVPLSPTDSAPPLAESQSQIMAEWRDANSSNNAAVLADSRTVRKGAPTKYNTDIAKRICELVAGTTLTLHQIAREVGLGHGGVILAWAHRHEEFGQQYARAREHQMQLRADELLEIADDASNDWIEVATMSGRVVRTLDHEHVKRSEIRIKTRQWLMARYAPKVFGERLMLTGADGGSLKNLGTQTDKERYEGAVKLMEQIRTRLREADAAGEV